MPTPARFAQSDELAALRAFETLVQGNPFLPERVEAERTALGPRYVDHGWVWHAEAHPEEANPNLEALIERAETLAAELRARLSAGVRATAEELESYQVLVLYVLFERHQDAFYEWTIASPEDASSSPAETYERYRRDFDALLHIPRVRAPELDPAVLFAFGYQIRRAFHHTYRGIYGASAPAARLRASVWQSIFTHDVRRYRRGLYARMADIPTLVLGPSGTGKELVARAIGLSGFLAFDPRRKRFESPADALFWPVNLAALPAALIESELFGHRRGAFTGAQEDRAGWLESCPAPGTVFLDEIGELEPALQTKLLRVLQSRSFQRVGETRERRFTGRIVAATHRDLVREMEAGRFRADLYYRLCADIVETPSLAEQISAAPEELERLVQILAMRLVGADEVAGLTREVVDWVDAHLGRDYGWPGNVRELEQCLRNVLVRGSYHPIAHAGAAPQDAFLRAVAANELSADALLRAYCTRVYHREGSYEGAARRLQLDRRTVKSYLDPELLETLRES